MDRLDDSVEESIAVGDVVLDALAPRELRRDKQRTAWRDTHLGDERDEVHIGSLEGDRPRLASTKCDHALQITLGKERPRERSRVRRGGAHLPRVDNGVPPGQRDKVVVLLKQIASELASFRPLNLETSRVKLNSIAREEEIVTRVEAIHLDVGVRQRLARRAMQDDVHGEGNVGGVG